MSKNEVYLNTSVSADKNEFEIVPNNKLRHVNIFISSITHRSFHFHNELELFAVLGGNAVVRRNSGISEINAGDIVLFNYNEVHDINSEAGVTGLVLQLSSSFLGEYYPRLSNTMFTCDNLRSTLDADAYRGIWETLLTVSSNYINGGNLYELRCVSGLCELLAALFAYISSRVINDADYMTHKKISQRIERLSSYINSNYQYAIRLAEVAEVEGISPTHLSHFFTQNFGVSFQQYVNNIRFEHAIRLMDDPSISISEISAASGFSDPKYMSRIFFQHFGCSPKDFRAQYSVGQSPSQTRSSVLSEQHYSDRESIQLIEDFRAIMDTVL